MKRYYVFPVIALMAFIILTGCGRKNEEVSTPPVEIENISDETEKLPENTTEESATENEYAKEDFMGDEYVRSTLTNLWIKKEDALTRPIAVMMPVDSSAQPQYNIGSAGILYEAPEEGGISRQMAVIENWQDMEKIGNIRSIRSYYVWLGAEWDAILIHFGGPYHAQAAITTPGVDYITGTTVGQENTSGQRIAGNAFFRTKDKKAPHNAYTSAKLLENAIQALGYDKEHRSIYRNSEHYIFAQPSQPNTLESYSDAENAAAIDLSAVFPYTKSRLEYNAAEGAYYKWLLNSKQIDAATQNNEQLAFANVIIQKAKMEVLDAKGYLDFDIIGSGTGYYCTMGKAIPVIWRKASPFAPTKYYDENGNEIIFNTGKTYIAISPEDKSPVFQS